MADAANHHGTMAIWGSQIYFYARVLYLPIYVAGIPIVRLTAGGRRRLTRRGARFAGESTGRSLRSAERADGGRQDACRLSAVAH